MSDAYARIEKGEAWLIGAHIAPFEQGNRYNHEPKRTRKLLLHRREIDELLGRAQAERPDDRAPPPLHQQRGKAKLELGLGPRQAAPRPAPRHRRARFAPRRRARAGRRAAGPLGGRRAGRFERWRPRTGLGSRGSGAA